MMVEGLGDVLRRQGVAGRAVTLAVAGVACVAGGVVFVYTVFVAGAWLAWGTSLMIRHVSSVFAPLMPPDLFPPPPL